MNKLPELPGAFYHALLSGLIAQFLVDPEHALSAQDLTHALREIATGMQPSHKPSKTKSERAQKNPRGNKEHRCSRRIPYECAPIRRNPSCRVVAISDKWQIEYLCPQHSLDARISGGGTRPQSGHLGRPVIDTI